MRAANGKSRILLAAGLLAAMAAGAACWARVPAVFDPAPRRLDAAALAFSDLTGHDRVTLLVFGDAGSGSSDQLEVGRRMAEVCAARGCDLAVTLGDNFYQRGVRPPRNGVWDAKFEEKFEVPYRGLGELQVWAVAGNHDWYGGRASVDTEIAYSLRSPRWRMPSHDYSIPGLPPWLTIYALDTVVLVADVDIGQSRRARTALCDAPGWRILTGHHPLYSTGRHGGSEGRDEPIAEILLPVLAECDVDLYLSGHEHHQEHLVAGDLHQIVQGAAGNLRDVGVRDPQLPAEQLFAASRFGFALLDIERTAIAVEFYGYPRDDPDGFGSIYRATITARRPAAADLR